MISGLAMACLPRDRKAASLNRSRRHYLTHRLSIGVAGFCQAGRAVRNTPSPRRPDRPASKRGNRSGLIAKSFQDGRGDEFLAPRAARGRSVRGAPVRKCLRVDPNPQDDVAVSREPAFHFLGDFQPLLPAQWHLVAVLEDLQQRRIVFLLDPVSPDRRRRRVLGIRHGCRPTIGIAAHPSRRPLRGLLRMRSSLLKHHNLMLRSERRERLEAWAASDSPWFRSGSAVLLLSLI